MFLCDIDHWDWIMSRSRRRLKLPRAPLPKQKGGAHKLKTKVLDRKRKHKGKEDV